MNQLHHRLLMGTALAAGALFPTLVPSPIQDPGLPKAFVTGEGWDELTLADFVNVNGTDETWTERDGVIVCTGKPIGGARSQKRYRNFELVLEWRHHTHGGNSGVFLWCPESAFTDLPPGTLPRSGIWCRSSTSATRRTG